MNDAHRSRARTLAKLRTADLSAKHVQLVAEYQDLDVLGAVIRRACEKASHRAGDQGEEEQHPRMLRIGELEGESEFRPLHAAA